MKTEPYWQETFENALQFAKWSFALLIDAAFLSLWVFTTWLVDEYVISRMALSGVDAFVLNAFQLLFNVTTLIPVIAYVVKDTVVIIARTARAIRGELKAINQEEEATITEKTIPKE